MITTTRLAALEEVARLAGEYKRLDIKEVIDTKGPDTLFELVDKAHRALFAALDELEKVTAKQEKEETVG